jgi:hypothetical protein
LGAGFVTEFVVFAASVRPGSCVYHKEVQPARHDQFQTHGSEAWCIKFDPVGKINHAVDSA